MPKFIHLITNHIDNVTMMLYSPEACLASTHLLCPDLLHLDCSIIAMTPNRSPSVAEVPACHTKTNMAERKDMCTILAMCFKRQIQDVTADLVY